MNPVTARASETALKQPEPKRVEHEGVRLRADVERRSGVQTPKIGVIYNPKSAANLGKSPLRAIGVACGRPTTRTELLAVLRGFADAEVNIVAVSGGDGTIREVLTAIPQAYGDQPHPAIAILAAGRTDLIAGEVGSSGRRDELARLLASAKAGELRHTRRPVLRVEGVMDADGNAVTPRGMLMGAAAFAYGTELCQTEVHADGASHATAIGITVARVVGRILFKGDPDGLLKGEPLSLSADGRSDEKGLDASRSLLLVSTLRERLVLGRTPFFGDYTEDQLQYVEVDAPAKGLPRALGSMVVRKPWLAGPGWNAGSAKTLDLQMQRSMIIDGEIFRPVDGRVRVTADPVVDFVAPLSAVVPTSATSPQVPGAAAAAGARDRLAARVREELSAPVLPEAHDVARYARQLHGDAYGPALFYGSCLRADSPEGIMDVYLLSRTHAAFHGQTPRGRALAGLNWLIPPNIYFWMIPHPQHGSLRAKVAVVTEQQFREGASVDAWSPSIWARFCQPCVLLDAPDEAARERVVDTIVTAILTAARWAAYLGPSKGTARDYWTALFAATYGAELRPERNNRPAIIYDAHPERYDALLRDAWAALEIPVEVSGAVLTPKVNTAAKAVAKRGFVARQRSGKGISVARIVKGALTFSGGVDYLLWKVERHSGVSVELSDWQRKHPFLGAPGVYLQLRRAGAVR